MAPRSKSVTLSILIAGDAKGISKAIDTTERKVSGLRGSLGKFGTFAAGALSGAAVLKFGRDSIAAYRGAAGEVAQLKRVTGETAENASLLRFLAQQSGVEVSKLAAAWGIFSKKVATGAVEKAGYEIRGTNGELLSSEQILGRVADRFAVMPDGPTKTAEALKLFGRGGADMIKILNRGSAGIADLRAEMEKLGLSFNETDLTEFGDYTAAQRDFSAAMQGIKFAVGREALPALTDLARAGSETLPQVARGISLVAEPVGDLATAFTKLPGPLRVVLGSAVGLSAAGVGLAATWGVLRTAVAAGIPSLGAQAVATQAATVATVELTAAEIAAQRAALSYAGATQAAAAANGTLAASTGAATAATAAGTAARGGALASIGAQAGALGSLSNVLIAVAAGYTAYKGATAFLEGQAKFSGDTEKLAADLEAVGSGSANADRLFGQLGGSAEDLAEKYQDMHDSVGKQLFSPGWVSDKSKSLEFLKTLDEQMAALAEQDPAKAKRVFRELTKEMTEQGVGIDEVNKRLPRYNEALTKAEEENGDAKGAIDETTGALTKQKTAYERATEAAERGLERMEKRRSLEEAAADAHDARKEAVAELADAERAAAGDSDENRRALEAIKDATEGVTDAEEELADRKQAAADAERDLSEARREAKVRIEDLARAARDAAVEESGAQLALERARAEQRRVNANSRSSDLDKREAAQKVREAENAARNATSDRARAEAEAARARAAGIEGDEQVVEAKRKVADANEAVRDAEQAVRDAVTKVGEAQAAQAAVIEEAKARVVEAAKKAEEAMFNEAKAWGDLVTNQFGAIAGVNAYREVLLKLAADLDENSPLRQRLQALADELARIGGIITAEQIAAHGGYAPGGDPALNGTGNPGAARPDNLRGRVTPNIVVNNIHQGTPTQQRRAHRRAATDTLDRVLTGARR